MAARTPEDGTAGTTVSAAPIGAGRQGAPPLGGRAVAVGGAMARGEANGAAHSTDPPTREKVPSIKDIKIMQIRIGGAERTLFL